MALVEVEHLKKYFQVAAGTNCAVDDVTFSIEEGRTLGVVGESGCGKSTLGRTVIRLLDATDGKVIFDGEDITYVKGHDLRRLREKVSIVFQDPYASLDPRYTVEKVIREPLTESHRYKRAEIDDRIDELMEITGVEDRLRQAYPHEMDGGRRQRVGIARALALNPKYIMCDEAVSALDVSVQAQILNLLMDLQEQYKLTYMFITHNLSVVKHISQDICVMYLGQMIEKATKEELFANPLHPYTIALLSAIPSMDVDAPMRRVALEGEITSAINPKPGCRFAPRCPHATEACQQPQELEEVSTGHFVACCRLKEIS